MAVPLHRILVQYLTRKPYGIHSPFLYDFAEICLYADEKLPEFGMLEGIRKEYKRSRELVMVTDFGAGAGRQSDNLLPQYACWPGGRQAGANGQAAGKPGHVAGTNGDRQPQAARYQRKVSTIARKALQKPKYCRLLYRMARYFKPSSVLELGSSLGISACYLAMGAPGARIITMEGCPETAMLARRTFVQAGLPQVELVEGPFGSTLPGLLKSGFVPDLVYIDGDHTYEGLVKNFHSLHEHISPRGVVIIDDIRWSRSMWKAWKEIASHPEVRLSLDIGQFGILFLDNRLGREYVMLGF